MEKTIVDYFRNNYSILGRIHRPRAFFPALLEDKVHCREVLGEVIGQLPEDQQEIIKRRSGWNGKPETKVSISRDLYGSESIGRINYLEHEAMISIVRADEKIRDTCKAIIGGLAYNGENVSAAVVYDQLQYEQGISVRKLSSRNWNLEQRLKRVEWKLMNPEEKEEKKIEEFSRIPIEALDTSVMTIMHLESLGCKNLADVYNLTDNELRSGTSGKRPYRQITRMKKELDEKLYANNGVLPL
jgi:hypothetical protein